MSQSDEHEDRETRRERSYSVLIQGRERVLRVLEPHLGPVHALERANNIAQALVFEDAEPLGVALEMLRGVPQDDRAALADAVRRAWLKGDERHSRPHAAR